MSEFNAHLSARGATRRISGTPYTSRNNYAPGPLHVDIDEPPKPWRFAPLIALLVMIFFLLLQLLPATHYRHPFDPYRQWKDIIPSHPTEKQTITNSSMQAETPEYVHIFSWSDDLDLRPLAVLVNSTISSSRNPGKINFYLLIPDDLEDSSDHNFMALFPKSKISIYRHNVIREWVKIIASDGENSILDFPYLLPFYIPKIFQNIRRFIYLVPDIIVKDKVEDLLQVNLTNSPVAAVEDCSQNFEVINAIKKSSARPLGTQTPYTNNTCILDPSVLLVNADLLAKENFIEVIKLWRKMLQREGSRDGRSDQEIMLALNGNYTKLDASWNIRESRFSGIGSDVKIFHFDGEKKPWLKQAEGEDRAKRLRGSPPEDLNGNFSVNELGSHWFGESTEKIDSVSEIGGSSSGPSATLFSSPKQKSNSYEPRSVLDLVVSPGLKPQISSSLCSQPMQQLFTETADYNQGFTISDLQDIQKSSSVLTNLQQPEAMLPRTIIPSSFPFSSNAWVESIISDFAVRGQADAATNGQPNRTNSSSCSEPLTSHRNDDGNSSGNDSGDGGSPHEEHPSFVQPESGEGAISREQTQMEQGLELANLLIACAEAVTSKSLQLVNHLLSRLGELASPEGSPMHRVAAYFTEGLTLRVTKLWPHIFQPIVADLDLCDEDLMTGFQLLNHTSPIPKFFQYTANEIILKAFEDKDRVHIIDFDIKQGLQWPALFHSLATRPRPPSHVRITGIGESKEDLQDTGDRLAGFAEALNLPFEFHAVVDKLEDVRLWMLHVKEKETVAVNCMLQLHKTLYDNGAALRGILGLIQSTKPAVVVVVEQEANHNDPIFEGRFLQALQYYSAIFDSIDASLPSDSPARLKMEQFFAREIRNIIACEGPERIERHEKFEHWKQLIEEGGFTAVPLGEREHCQARILLDMFPCKNYRVKLEDGRLTLGWLEQPLYTASAWAPQDGGNGGASTSSPA